uniref:Uncharacterized protein n=1 Tax=Medicago truncatula TaxID=3880 RepID=A2Q4L1_MEDTR|nr:hypothetical protein MtrDRAFT_AC157503g34v2 [Medicago truncatula]
MPAYISYLHGNGKRGLNGLQYSLQKSSFDTAQWLLAASHAQAN